MSILITGGTGWVGTGLAHRLVERGEEVILFDIAPQIERVAEIKNNVKVVQGDATVWPEVLNVLKENNVEGILHLTRPESPTPWAAYEGHVSGIMHVLEAARLFEVKTVLFTSSMMTYGLGIPTDTITDETLQRPDTEYGVTKLYGELIGRSYRKRFDLDFRCIRYPNIFGPSVRISKKLQYIAWMILNAALGRPAECAVSEDTKIPVMYYEDAMRATQMLYDAPKEQIETVCYNIVSVFPSLTAKEVELAIKKFIPEAKFTYKPDPWAMDYIRNLNNIDDSRAREEWGWEPLYADFEKGVADFIKEVRSKPEYYSRVALASA